MMTLPATRLRGMLCALVLLLGAAPLSAQALADGLEALLSGVQRERDEGPTLPPPTELGVGENTGFAKAPGGLLELHARNLDVMDSMAQLRQLTRRNIVVSDDVDARFTGDLYDVSFEEAIAIICRSANLEWTQESNYLHIGRAKIVTRHFKLNHARADDLVALIEPMLSAEGHVSGTQPSEVGIASFASDESAGGGDYAALDVLVVQDYAERMAEISEIISTVDAQPRQVLVEATILTAEISDTYDLGTDITTVFGSDFQEIGATTSGSGAEIDEFRPQLADDGLVTGATSLSSGLPSGGLRLGFLKDGIGAFVTALQSVTTTNVLASPKIITLNKQRGEVLLGRRDGFLTTTVSQTSTTQSVEFLETGTRLIYRPFITDDGFVRLEIHPEDSDGGVDAAGLPFKETTEITTNVMVRGGETVVIGGLFREKERVIHRKVPWLGDIPWLGELFRSRSEEMVREEIIIFLTPHIIDFAAQLAAEEVANAAMPRPVELAKSYVDAARELVARREFGSAEMMLAAVNRLGVRLDEVDDLRRQIWRDRVLDYDEDLVDGLILELLMGTPVTPGTSEDD
ncbi:MAG: hypothetical protein DHS20C15_19820 [Planctomycetota bacterium]|nr:MAG: hypothetical protein DHS20C15_19820 [Planctomycetota bacterium]